MKKVKLVMDAALMAETVDKLGRVKARLAPLLGLEKDLKIVLYNAGPGTYDGKLFMANVMDNLRTTPDTEAWGAKLLELGVTQKWLDAHQKKTAYPSVRVEARAGKAKRAEAA